MEIYATMSVLPRNVLNSDTTTLADFTAGIFASYPGTGFEIPTELTEV